MEMKKEKNDYEEVKVYVGYEMPMKDDSYAKDKASVGFSYTKGGNKIDREKVEEDLYKVADRLAEKLGDYLVTRGKEVVEAEVARRVGEIEKEYEEKLNIARQQIKTLGKK